MTNASENNRQHLVKLTIEGKENTVNTVEDHKNDRGMSLVCPFPALEVDIPVHLQGEDETSQSGVIHRIGVEDDPETGLPKLRLSVRSTSPTTAQQECIEVDEEAVTQELQVDQLISNVEKPIDELIQEQMDDHPELEIEVTEQDDDLYSLGDIDKEELQTAGQEPGWIASEMQFSASANASRSRKGRRVVAAVASWVIVLGMAGAGGWVLQEAGVVDIKGLVSSVRGMISPQDAQSPQEAPGNSLDQLAGTAARDTTVQEKMPTATVETVPVAQFAETAMDEGSKESDAAVHSDAVIKTAKEPIAPLSDEVADDTTMTSDEMVEEEVAENSAASMKEVQVYLPTKWPAEYTTSYRLRNPNGVVVDVPGGLIKKRGWLDVNAPEAIVKSVKSMQMENGARFVVYVNGGLPNYKIKPDDKGVRLTIYYEDGSPVDTQQVAMND